MKITYTLNGIPKEVTLEKNAARRVLRLLNLAPPIAYGNANRRELVYNSVLLDYPILSTYKSYFAKYKSRNAYYMIMKQHITNKIYSHILAEDPRRSMPLIAYILGNKSHASIYNNLEKDTEESRHIDFNEVAGISDHMIAQGLYPTIKGYTISKELNPHDDYDRITIYKWEQL